ARALATLQLLEALFTIALVFVDPHSAELAMCASMWAVRSLLCPLCVLANYWIRHILWTSLINFCNFVNVAFSLILIFLAALGCISLSSPIPTIIRTLLEHSFGGVSVSVVRILAIVSTAILIFGYFFVMRRFRLYMAESYRLLLLTGQYQIIGMRTGSMASFVIEGHHYRMRLYCRDECV
ncbi:hypothetical protein PMAYCL1PPCAC_04752, partial [Pristionchus mayeri]